MDIQKAQEQWRGIIQHFKAGKPRTTPQLMHKYAGVLGAVLCSTEIPLPEVLSDCHSLPAGVVGIALAQSYGNMPKERRHPVWEWISRQEAERQDAERAYAAPGVMRISPESACRCLLGLRSSPLTKELRERLASVLGDVEAHQFASLLRTKLEQHEVRKLVRLLFIVAEDARADHNLRAAILEGILPAVSEHRLYSGADNFRPQIMDLIGRLAPQSAGRIRAMLPLEMLERPAQPAQPAPKATPAGESASPSPEPVPEPAVPTAPECRAETTPDPLAWFDANIQMLAHARLFYVQAREQLGAERSARQKLELDLQQQAVARAALDAAQARNVDLQNRVSELTRARDLFRGEAEMLRANLENTVQGQRSAEASFATEREAFARERDELSRRIDVHAEKVLTDLKIAIANAVSPLIQDLPEHSSPKLPELAPNLLVIVQQVIRALSARGVPLRHTVGELR